MEVHLGKLVKLTCVPEFFESVESEKRMFCIIFIRISLFDTHFKTKQADACLDYTGLFVVSRVCYSREKRRQSFDELDVLFDLFETQIPIFIEIYCVVSLEQSRAVI